MEKNKKFYVIANKETGKFYKADSCVENGMSLLDAYENGKLSVKLIPVNLNEATIFMQKTEARYMIYCIEDENIFKQWLRGTITIAEVSYKVNYLI